VAEGELTASLFGPFVGFHHQSLLIAALWPSGRGNVGYGANIGSNHTGKAPDQEVRPGEGTFFGLATSIKFPFNMAKSPYSIIASGVTCMPQKLEMPFSLINSPSENITGLSNSINEIIPAWMLTNCMYALLRNESKFKSRQSQGTEHMLAISVNVFCGLFVGTVPKCLGLRSWNRFCLLATPYVKLANPILPSLAHAVDQFTLRSRKLSFSRPTILNLGIVLPLVRTT
jgi:hypothetical protein